MSSTDWEAHVVCWFDLYTVILFWSMQTRLCRKTRRDYHLHQPRSLVSLCLERQVEDLDDEVLNCYCHSYDYFFWVNWTLFLSIAPSLLPLVTMNSPYLVFESPWVLSIGMWSSSSVMLIADRWSASQQLRSNLGVLSRNQSWLKKFSIWCEKNSVTPHLASDPLPFLLPVILFSKMQFIWQASKFLFHYFTTYQLLWKCGSRTSYMVSQVTSHSSQLSATHKYRPQKRPKKGKKDLEKRL